MGLARDDRVAERETPPRRDLSHLVGEDLDLVADLARQDCQTAGRFEARHLRQADHDDLLSRQIV